MNKQYLNAVDSLTTILENDCSDNIVYEERGKTYFMNEEY